jgi:hypothetical protein
MKFLTCALMLSCVLATTGCYVDNRDPHRGWWDEHHRGEAYDSARAEREHRDWCGRSYDRSCEGWYHR